MRRTVLAGCALATALVVGSAGVLSGCKLIGGMAASARRNSKRTVDAEYLGLRDRSFAVVVAAGRAIQTDQPEIIPLLTRNITDRLREHAGADSFVPADDILQFQYSNPRWETMHPVELARELANVDRLVYVDLQEYALTSPGNPYVWDGVATAMIGVLETDGAFPDEFTFTKDITVKFPDVEGLGPLEIAPEVVQIALARRFVDRSSWLFYEHEEDFYPKY